MSYTIKSIQIQNIGFCDLLARNRKKVKIKSYSGYKEYRYLKKATQIKKKMKKQWAIKIISMLLIILWVYAAGSKLIVYHVFAFQLARQPLPSWSKPILQWTLPAVELLTVALLSFPKTLNQGFMLSFLLLAAFTLYVGFGLAHVYSKVPCSCGGILNGASWGEHLVFNIVFTILAFIGWFMLRHGELEEMNGHAKLNIVE